MLCRTLCKQHGGRIIKGWEDLVKSLVAIAGARFVISTRLHPAICAASYGTPLRILAYDKKHMEFANSISAGSLLVDPHDQFGPIIDDLRNQSRILAPGTRKWHDAFDDFCGFFRSV